MKVMLIGLWSTFSLLSFAELVCGKLGEADMVWHLAELTWQSWLFPSWCDINGIGRE